MKFSLRSLPVAALLATVSLATQAQSPQPVSGVVAVGDTARIVLDPALIKPVSLQSFEAFRTAVQPLIKQMAGKKIVALGEGTHGTAEFYRVRFWLTRILMEEHGFKQVAFENTYGDSYLLNQALQNRSVADLKPLMKKHLLSMWQNREVEQLLTWMQARNSKASRKVTFSGIDAMFGTADAQLLHDGLAQAGHRELRPLTAQLLKSASYQDSLWLRLNDKEMKMNYAAWRTSGWRGYEAADKLAQALPTLRLPKAQRTVLENAAQNSRMVFDMFYQAKVHKRESSRDSSMAEMARLLVREPGSKLIIWAHDAHVSRRAALAQDGGDDNGGGAGGFLERMFPGQYFVLGTSTAAGTFAATPQNFISPVSPMAAYPLSKPSAGSWEESLSYVAAPGFFFDTHALGTQNLKRPHRVVGQTPESQAQYATYKLGDAYDALLFLRQTTAATPL
ncbi:erythromycin esterase family protein [Hymenobacter terrenus]|uniref:erythromycin esterase family protein n=1 Tax=Hymenobacter terrenus TaxID=1629124 RepID=UPI000619311E|nr:erythromycin esterase family protein [Hymenobacter terrenus]